jgi:CheY-like chemotaxis protein
MQSVRVLLAHPDPGLLSACRDHLTNEGFEVAAALTGLECLARLRTFVPDVLVLEMDLTWGGGDGVLARMREDPDLPRVPVVILSSRSGPGRFARAPAGVPVAERLSGPLTPLRLAKTVSDYAGLYYRVRDHEQATV